MADSASDTKLLVLHNAEGEEWTKREVRAAFESDRMVLHGARDDLPAVAIDSTSITSITLAVSTLPKTGSQIDRSFFCTVEVGSDRILEAAISRPMRSTLGWLRDEPGPDVEQHSEAYRHFVRQLHGWLARHGSCADFQAQQPVLGNPGIAHTLLYIAVFSPMVLGFLLILNVDRRQIAATLGLPRLLLDVLPPLVLAVCVLGCAFLAFRLYSRLTNSRERSRPYDPNRLPEELLPPSRER